jgi:NitT/TauT family transport system ATP-binding protein
MVELDHITFSYPGSPRPVFQDFCWSIAERESWAVIGPSGCGKTTLLYLMAGLRFPQTGRILVDGTALVKPRRTTGLVLQDYGLLPWATVWENVALGLLIRGVNGREAKDRIAPWLERLGLSSVITSYPAQLSGGQRQRVAIARTLVLDPTLLLMDEPFSSLDAITREGLQNMVIELGLASAMTTVLVTHNIEEAVLLGRRLLVLGSPPIRGAVILENPGAGHTAYRESPAFLAMCRTVRAHVEGNGQEVGP